MEAKSFVACTDNRPLLFRIKGGVILKIWYQVILATLFSIVIVCFHSYVPDMKMEFPMYLVSVLGLVIGLLLVFRTNTAYDRYWEGRKIWANMTNYIRILTRCCWLGIKESETEPVKDLIEKVSAINILIALAYATKNYLREEYSYDADEEIQELINHIPKFNTPTSVSGFSGKIQQTKRNGQSEKEPNLGKSVLRKSVQINIPESESDKVESKEEERKRKFRLKERLTMSTRRKASEEKHPVKRRDSTFMAHDYVVPSNIPLELIYYFQSYVYCVMKREMVDGTTTFVLMGSLNNLMDSLTQFERILRTPIPLAYSIHLHQSVWLYLLSLPFQLVGQLGWFTVAAMALASFALLGILAIGWEIENPFGYDDNDLPLDDFCEVIKNECTSIMGRKLPDPDAWIFSTLNHPISTTYETAAELRNKSVQELREMLAESNLAEASK